MKSSTKSQSNDEDERQTKQAAPNKNYSVKSRKGMKRQAGQINHKKQNKLTHYFAANSLSATNEVAPDPQQSKLTLLKEELAAKEQQLNKIRNQKDFYENKYNVLYMDTRVYKNKAKDIIIKALSQEAEKKRLEKRRIDNRLGYYIQAQKRKFIVGEDLVKIKNILKQKNERLQNLKDSLKKSRSNDQINSIKFAITFIKKEIGNIETEYQNKERQIVLYRQRLRLAEKQAACTYAQDNWVVVKDSHGRDRYLPLQLLGQGGFGQVYKCYDLQSIEYVAIKINKIKISSKDSENHFKHIQREVNTHWNLKHNNIAQIKQVLEINTQRVIFVLEYCEGPQLSYYLKKKKCIQEKDAKKIIHQVFSALKYLYECSPRVIHYDLKPSNIMFHHGIVKILDFGLCKMMDSEESRMELTSQGTGTYWYLPPETFAKEFSTITAKVDVWSTGIIFYQMLYGKRPFANGVCQNQIWQQNLIVSQSANFKFPDSTPNGYKVSKQAQNFIRQCLTIIPDKRLSATQAYEHKYFNQ